MTYKRTLECVSVVTFDGCKQPRIRHGLKAYFVVFADKTFNRVLDPV